MLGLGVVGLIGQAQAQTTVCAGQQACLTLPAHRGNVQWESSPDQNTWTAMPGGTTDTLCFTATADGYYRAIITEGTCAPVISSVSAVTVSTVVADAGVDAAVCGGVDIPIGGSPAGSGGTGPYTYAWTPSTSLNDPTLSNPLANITGPTTLVLSVTDANGCVDLDTVSLDTGGVATPGSATFSYTGAQQIFVVPTCVTAVTINSCGAQGGANWVNNTNFGGCTQATIPVLPGETLYVYVGQQPPSGTVGGYNGGGAGDGAGKGGGGGSDVRKGGITLNDRVVVGGGGGGAGYWSNLHVVGGVGGGLIGGDGSRMPSDPGGLGASQSGPGASGTCINFNVTAMAGAFGQGGTPLGSNCGCEGYGGGGGWYGGAGSGNCRGGGGGSGYAIPTATNVSYTSGTQVGNGVVTISW
jgi:hypothetical protein